MKKIPVAVLNILKTVCFLLIVMILLNFSSMYIKPVSNQYYWLNYSGGILAEPKDTIQYVSIGSSNCAAGISPLTIYSEYGYTGYTCGEAWQNLIGSYYMLTKIYKTQTPKLVILETDSFFDGRNLLVSVENNCKTLIEWNFPIIRYHDSWKKMIDSGDKPDYTWQHTYRGQRVNTDVGSCDASQAMGYRGRNYIFRPTYKYYFNKILQLCKSHGTEVMVLSIPCCKDWSQNRHDATQAFCDEKKIPYVDLNMHIEELGFDFTKDYRDKGTHLNNWGANKVSKYLGKYIHENYVLDDRRGNSDFSRWDNDSETYLKECN